MTGLLLAFFVAGLIVLFLREKNLRSLFALLRRGLDSDEVTLIAADKKGRVRFSLGSRRFTEPAGTNLLDSPLGRALLCLGLGKQECLIWQGRNYTVRSFRRGKWRIWILQPRETPSWGEPLREVRSQAEKLLETIGRPARPERVELTGLILAACRHAGLEAGRDFEVGAGLAERVLWPVAADPEDLREAFGFFLGRLASRGQILIQGRNLRGPQGERQVQLVFTRPARPLGPLFVFPWEEFERKDLKLIFNLGLLLRNGAEVILLSDSEGPARVQIRLQSDIQEPYQRAG